MGQVYDVIVIGLGGMGSAAAYQLAKRGRKVLGLEQFGPAHDQGSSHGGSRIIRQAYYEDPAYVPLILRAYELWRELERESGRKLLTITGGLMLGEAGSEVVAGSLASAQQHGLPHERLSAEMIRKRFPALQPPAGVAGIYEVNAGYLHPENCVEAYLDQALAHGATLRFYETVTGWKATARGVTVQTASSSYTAARLVVCPGPWASSLLHDMGVEHRVERVAQFWFDAQDFYYQFRPSQFPVFLWEVENGVKLYGFPALDGRAAGVKVAYYPTRDWTTAEGLDRNVRQEEVMVMRNYLQGRIPSLASADCIRTITCMHTFSPDGHFVVGHHPRHANVVVASGFSAHGFKFASVIGEIVADLSVAGETRHPVALFSPRRFG